MKIGIINYGMGNLASVKNAFDYLNIPSEIFSDPGEIANYDKLLLPGVGAFGQAMQNLRSSGFEKAIRESVSSRKVPILGICLGMQLLLSRSSEHGEHEGLDLVKGEVINFGKEIKDLPVPHMGWNDLDIKDSSLVSPSNGEKPSFYFVHSFFCRLQEPQYVTGFAQYGIPFHAMFERGHISGCQFHPEKSQKNGLGIFVNFASKSHA
jgi:glutamine amidotransferase